MTYKLISRSFIAFLVLAGLSQEAVATDTALDRQSLKGLKAFKVVVEDIDPVYRAEAEQHGLSKALIQTDVELRLRQLGIPVSQGTAATTVLRYLYVALTLFKSPSITGLWAYDVEVEFDQGVLLERDPSISGIAATWSANGGTGIVGVDKLGTLRDYIRDKIDNFANAYLSVNPK